MVRATSAGVFLCLALLLPALAHGQASRSGPTFSLGGTTAPVSDPDVAHDSLHNLYMQVAGKGFIEAHLVNQVGTLLASFRVNASGEYAQTPRVAYSPDVADGGGYLVTWHATLGAFTRVRARIFRFDGVPLTGDFEIATSANSAATSSNWTMGASVVYSTGSREFLVAWMGYYPSTNDIFFQRVAPSGGLLGGNTRVSAGTPDWERDPSVAYNPHLDEFFIAYAAYSEAGRYGYVAARRVKAGSGAFNSGQLQYGSAVSTYVPAVTYNTSTQQYLLGWYNRSPSSAAVYGATLDAGGGVIGDLRVLSPFYAAYDALDIDYSPAAGQSLLVTHGGGSSTPWEDAGVSIQADGTPYDNGFMVTNTTDVRGLRANPGDNDGNFNPRLAASTSEPKWLMVTSSLFAATSAQFVSSSATNVAPTPGPVAQPGSNPMLMIDMPRTDTTVASTFTVAGWAADTGSASGTGVTAIHVWAFPLDGSSPIFLGEASLGVVRPDVGAYLGSRFTGSGYGLTANLGAGTYILRVGAFSSVTGTFNTLKDVKVTVLPPASQPRMYVDSPAQNQTVSQNVTVVGWAVDQASRAGAGVDAVHVWAFPLSGGGPIWVGAASIGFYRGDVGAYFGSPIFANSGFYLQGALPPGEYNLVVYAFSSIAGYFNQATTVRIRVV